LSSCRYLSYRDNSSIF